MASNPRKSPEGATEAGPHDGTVAPSGLGRCCSCCLSRGWRPGLLTAAPSGLGEQTPDDLLDAGRKFLPRRSSLRKGQKLRDKSPTMWDDGTEPVKSERASLLFRELSWRRTRSSPPSLRRSAGWSVRR